MATKTKATEELVGKFSMMPQEAMLTVMNKEGKLFIGVPKESSFQENRVALIPEAVAVLVGRGHRVVIESNAGEGSHIYDIDYTDAGGEIVYSREEVFKADIILKCAPLKEEELNMLHMNQVVISPIHLPTLTGEQLKRIINKKITAIAFEYIKDEADTFPIVRSMSEIAGNAAIMVASEFLANLKDGKGILLGGITGVPPASVVILGAGTVGEYAARTALGLGAEVKIFDNSIYKLKRLQNHLGVRIYTSIIRQDILQKALQHADVAIGAIHSKLGNTPMIVTDHMVSNMKAGSVIIDVSIDQGGCFETSEVTSHEKPFFKKYDVIHYCVPNIPSRVPRTASLAISNVLTPLLLETHQLGGLDKMLQNSLPTRNGVYIYKGHLTNKHLSEKFEIKFTDLELFFTSAF